MSTKIPNFVKKCLRKTGSNMSAPLEKQKHYFLYYCCTHCLSIGSKLTKQGYQCHNRRHKIQLSTLQISNYLREYQNEIISLLIKIWAIEASTVCVCVQMMPFFKVFSFFQSNFFIKINSSCAYWKGNILNFSKLTLLLSLVHFWYPLEPVKH